MFWTLVVMTLGGTPLPTNLVFDSIEACYEAEEQMARERARYATEWGARSSEKRELPEFVRQNLVRGVCVPHSPTGMTHNLPIRQEREPDADRVYHFSETGFARNQEGAASPFRVFIAPILEYRLPQVPMSFRLTVQNQSDDVIKVRNPLQLLFLSFQRPDAFPIELPTRVPELIVQRMDSSSDRPLRGPSNVEFRTAIVNGKEDTAERNICRIEPGSFLEVVFECEKVVGEQILASYLERHIEEDERYVNVSALMNLFFVDTGGGRSLQMDEKIRLQVPNP